VIYFFDTSFKKSPAPPSCREKKLRQDTPLQNAENTGEYGFLTIYEVKS